MISDAQLSRSKAIQRRTGRTFHIATRLLPQHIRHPTYVLYAFFRLADQVVDDPHPAPPDLQRAELTRIREAALGQRETDDPVLEAFAEVRKRNGIPDREVEAFIGAMLDDVNDENRTRVGFDDDEELYDYLRGSAVAVAYMMLAVMDPKQPEVARPHARALGEAFQLTNFLRDVREDIEQYDRVYIPRNTLERTGADVSDIVARRWTPAFRDAMKQELERAEDKYRHGVAGIRYLPEGCRFPVLMASIFYAEYHRSMRQRAFDVLAEPPSLTMGRYATLIARAGWYWWRGATAEEVFYRVSPIDPIPTRPEDPPMAEGTRERGRISMSERRIRGE